MKQVTVTGRLSFYGLSRISVLDGNPDVQGYATKPGNKFDFFSPNHSLPLQFFSDSSFSLQFEPLSWGALSHHEMHFYIINPIPEGFEQVYEGAYISHTFPRIEYPEHVLHRINEESQKNGISFFIAGDKGTGKSLFSRFLTNKLLNTHKEVVYIDLDIGQPENSLPGTFSYRIISKPIFSPPEMRSDQWPSIFYGNPSIHSMNLYLNGITRMISKLPRSSMYVINSLGYITNRGADLHMNLLSLFKPDVFFMLHPSNESPHSEFPNAIPIPITKIVPGNSISPKTFRDLRYITCLTRSKGPLLSIRPSIMSLKGLRIHVFTENRTKFPAEEILEVIQGKIVFFNRSRIETPRDEQISIIPSVGTWNVDGVGFIKSVDIENYSLNIVTKNSLFGVNTLIVMFDSTPSRVYTDTDSYIISYDLVGKKE